MFMVYVFLRFRSASGLLGFILFLGLVFLVVNCGLGFLGFRVVLGLWFILGLGLLFRFM